MGRLTDLLAKQGARLDRLTGRRIRATLSALDDGRRALLELLSQPARAAVLRVMLSRAEFGVSELQRRLGAEFAETERLVTDASLVDLREVLSVALPDLPPTHPLFPLVVSTTSTMHPLAERLAIRQGLLLHRYSLRRYGAQVVEAIQREIVAGVAAGLSQDQIARRVASAAGSVVSNHKGRAELIVRMEVGRAYNDSYLEWMQGVDALDPRPDDPLLKRIDEYIDARNHPFSRVADQQTVPVNEPFRVSVSEVAATASAMGRRSGGVLWPAVGNAYEGHNLPAHYNDRGRIVAWRKSWGN